MTSSRTVAASLLPAIILSPALGIGVIGDTRKIIVVPSLLTTSNPLSAISFRKASSALSRPLMVEALFPAMAPVGKNICKPA
jgi:hypothetical protein